MNLERMVFRQNKSKIFMDKESIRLLRNITRRTSALVQAMKSI